VTQKQQEPLAKKRILVVDDEPDARTYTRTVLEDYGAEVLVAADGDEALNMIRKELPDLVTLDLGMPGKSGVDVFHEMRNDVAMTDIPVCIITGRPELRRLIYERANARPPEGYLNKPVDAETILRNVRKILEVGDRVGRGRQDGQARA
jgi:CheY-like chemotaxis protein